MLSLQNIASNVTRNLITNTKLFQTAPPETMRNHEGPHKNMLKHAEPVRTTLRT